MVGAENYVESSFPQGRGRAFTQLSSLFCISMTGVVQVPCRCPGQLLGMVQVPRRCHGQLSGVVQVPCRYSGQLSGVVQAPYRCSGQLSGVVQKLTYGVFWVAVRRVRR